MKLDFVACCLEGSEIFVTFHHFLFLSFCSTKKTYKVKSLHSSWKKREEERRAKKIMKEYEAELRAEVAAEKE